MDKLNSSLQSYVFPSPAKLNLFLYINGQRLDGYHELQTLFQFVDFGDELKITPRLDGKFTLSPNIQGVVMEQNLIYRAGKLLQIYTKSTMGADFVLTKRIPMGAGLGGGSSNAGTVLVALNKLWNTNLKPAELAQLGLQLGADVPIFVYGKSAFAEGVGEQFSFCEPAEKWYVVLNPQIEINTRKIFTHPKLKRNTPKRSVQECLTSQFKNDCEALVCQEYPVVKQLIEFLAQFAPAWLTGTGACVFAEFADEQSANAVFSQKPEYCTGFVAQGKNLSPLHKFMQTNFA